MITRIRGVLESVEGTSATIAVEGGAFAYEVLVPAFLAVELAPAAGSVVTLVTVEYLEGQGQGASFTPRIVGFQDAAQREFFTLLTSVSGIGNRKALRALAKPPATLARAIAEKDTRLLATMPEIGKRMAERIITELDGKVEPFLAAGVKVEVKSPGRSGSLGNVGDDAVLALMALGQTRGEAEENVRRALAKARKQKNEPETADEIVQMVFGAA
ncbi:MAG TPA: Holliday junction branch migration protein RuvA [Phycisphaerales bacterium]|nr:Holliday junction branch migration protein RuvA [Phycisphaerales bacterium]